MKCRSPLYARDADGVVAHDKENVARARLLKRVTASICPTVCSNLDII